MASVRAIVSFYLMPESGKVDGQPIHKEKFNVPIEKELHKELHNFKKHFEGFTSVFEIARSKDLGANPEVNFARINKVASGGVEAFTIRTQDAWDHELPSLVNGSGMLQGK